MVILAYAIILGILNKVRGGVLNRYWQNTLFWKIAAGTSVALTTYVLLPDANLRDSIMIGVLWFFALMPTWGAWIDNGRNPPDYSRGGVLRDIYRKIDKIIQEQRAVDFIMLTIRALMFLPIFSYITYDEHPFSVVLLVLPCAILWAASYDICGNVLKRPNWSEYAAGFFIGIFIAIGYSLNVR